jgi:hypothetical protein
VLGNVRMLGEPQLIVEAGYYGGDGVPDASQCRIERRSRDADVECSGLVRFGHAVAEPHAQPVERVGGALASGVEHQPDAMLVV